MHSTHGRSCTAAHCRPRRSARWRSTPGTFIRLPARRSLRASSPIRRSKRCSRPSNDRRRSLISSRASRKISPTRCHDLRGPLRVSYATGPHLVLQRCRILPAAWFINAVRSRISSARTRCSASTCCCAWLLTSTNRLDGRVTASQIASTSRASFLFDFTYARTERGFISLTSCPSFTICRAQYCAPPHDSIPTRQGWSCAMNSSSCRRRS